MGYEIKVGEAYMDYDKKYMCISIDIKQVHNPNAPDDNGRYNSIRPQFHVWSDFCKCMDLEEYFYGDSNRKDGIYSDEFNKKFNREESFIGQCDRVIPITQLDVDYIDKTFLNFRHAYPTSIPKFTESIKGPHWRDEEPITMDTINAHHVRLIWLGFWFKWAIKNCEHPAVYIG